MSLLVCLAQPEQCTVICNSQAVGTRGEMIDRVGKLLVLQHPNSVITGIGTIAIVPLVASMMAVCPTFDSALTRVGSLIDHAFESTVKGMTRGSRPAPGSGAMVLVCGWSEAGQIMKAVIFDRGPGRKRFERHDLGAHPLISPPLPAGEHWPTNAEQLLTTAMDQQVRYPDRKMAMGGPLTVARMSRSGVTLESRPSFEMSVV